MQTTTIHSELVNTYKWSQSIILSISAYSVLLTLREDETDIVEVPKYLPLGVEETPPGVGDDGAGRAWRAACARLLGGDQRDASGEETVGFIGSHLHGDRSDHFILRKLAHGMVTYEPWATLKSGYVVCAAKFHLQAERTVD